MQKFYEENIKTLLRYIKECINKLKWVLFSHRGRLNILSGPVIQKSIDIFNISNKMLYKEGFYVNCQTYAKIQTGKQIAVIPLKFLIKNGKKDKSELPGSKITIKTFQNQRPNAQIKVTV